MSLSSRLRISRHGADLTQAEMAEGVGVSVKTIRAWESGQREPTVSQIQRWADRSSVRSSWLAFADGAMQ